MLQYSDGGLLKNIFMNNLSQDFYSYKLKGNVRITTFQSYHNFHITLGRCGMHKL